MKPAAIPRISPLPVEKGAVYPSVGSVVSSHVLFRSPQVVLPIPRLFKKKKKVEFQSQRNKELYFHTSLPHAVFAKSGALAMRVPSPKTHELGPMAQPPCAPPEVHTLDTDAIDSWGRSQVSRRVFQLPWSGLGQSICCEKVLILESRVLVNCGAPKCLS